MPTNKIKHLVVDTSAFIKGAALQDIAEEAITVQEVIDEVTSKRQLRKLIVLPYNLRVKDVFTENIKFITDFSKKTGDYTSLSATDIKVMALTYQMEKEKVGIGHLKTEPTTQRTIKVTGLGHSLKNKDNSGKNPVEENAAVKEDKKIEETDQAVLTEKFTTLNLKKDCSETEIFAQHHGEVVCEDNTKDIEDFLVEAQDEDYESYESESEDDSGSDDAIPIQVLQKQESPKKQAVYTYFSVTAPDISSTFMDVKNGEWITPSNIQEKKKEMDHGDFIDKSVDVACITTDFAMQNVLKQIGLNVTAIDGRIIRHVRTFIFRCTTCYKTTSIMTKVFCPKCGHSTLKKVAVSIDEHGNQQIHINGRKPLTARGKRFSLPTPKGGQHFQYPIITEDQHVHKRKATRLAQMKNNPLDPDYIAGFSPFTMRDVNSKSAVLGVRNDKQDMKQWLRKGANDVRKKRK